MSSNSNNNSSASGGIGFCGLLAIVFITLKLLGVIAWSWLWVLAPLWIPTALVIVVLLVILIIHLIGSYKRKKKYEERRKARNESNN